MLLIKQMQVSFKSLISHELKYLSQKLNFQIAMSLTRSRFLPAVPSQSDFTEAKNAENSQGCLTKLVLVLHGNQLLIPLSFIPTQHQSGSPALTINFLFACLDAKSAGDQIIEIIRCKH